MNKILAVIFVYSLFSSQLFAQEEKAVINLNALQTPQPHYLPEYTFESCTNPARWLDEKHGLQASFASTNRHYFRTEVPDVTPTTDWQATAWKGERLNVLVLLWSP